MPSAAYEALANEEGLAIISEELFANLGVGTKNLTPLVSKMVSWMTKVAEFFGLPGSVTEWIHGLTRTDAEKFVGQMVRAAMGGDKNLAKTRGKFGTKIEDLSNQTRLRSLDSTLNSAANSVKAVNLPAGYLVSDLINSAPGDLAGGIAIAAKDMWSPRSYAAQQAHFASHCTHSTSVAGPSIRCDYRLNDAVLRLCNFSQKFHNMKWKVFSSGKFTSRYQNSNKVVL